MVFGMDRNMEVNLLLDAEKLQVVDNVTTSIVRFLGMEKLRMKSQNDKKRKRLLTQKSYYTLRLLPHSETVSE